MGAVAAPQAMGQTIVGKKALADALGWTRPKLDRRLLSDRTFPVKNRGDQTGGWAFVLEDVQAYLSGAPVAPTPPAIDQAQLRDAVAPPAPQPAAAVAVSPGGAAPSRSTARRSAHHEGEATARQRKDEAEARLKELKLGELLGEYMLRAEAEQVAADVFIVLAGELDALPEDLLKTLDLPASDEMADRVRQRIDALRFAVHQKLLPMLETSPAEG